MKTPTFRYRCALAKDDANSIDVEALKRRAWREQRIVVVAASDERLDIVERELVRQIGERLYGEKSHHSHTEGRQRG